MPRQGWAKRQIENTERNIREWPEWMRREAGIGKPVSTSATPPIGKPEPEIISFGRSFVKDYPEEEFKASLTRAFKEKRGDFIVLDSNARGQKFLAACAAWAIDQGWLYNDRTQEDDQCSVSSFRLTEAGRKAILG